MEHSKENAVSNNQQNNGRSACSTVNRQCARTESTKYILRAHPEGQHEEDGGGKGDDEEEQETERNETRRTDTLMHHIFDHHFHYKYTQPINQRHPGNANANANHNHARSQCTIPASPKRASASLRSCSEHENSSLGTPLRQPPQTLMSCCQTLPKCRVSPPIRSNLTR